MSASDFNYPTLREGDWLVHDFKFHTGEVLPELKLHYTCVGEPTGEPILVLHGTLGSGAGLLNPNFGGELLGGHPWVAFIKSGAGYCRLWKAKWHYTNWNHTQL